MSDLGYHAQVEGGRYGTANPETDSDPIKRAALQEAAQAQMRLLTQERGYIPPSYEGNPGVGPSWQMTGGPSNLPIIGWTAQNATGPAFHQPYTADHMGRIPDWEGDDATSVGAGAFDQNEGIDAFAFDRANRAPIGGAVLEYSAETNPNAPDTDVGGSMGDLEY